MKGLLGFIVFALVTWIFWMSWHWLRNPDRPNLIGRRRRRLTKKDKTKTLD